MRTDGPEEIATERLALLPLAVEHSGEMAEVLSDPRLHAFIGGSPATPAELRTRYLRLVTGSPDPSVSWLNWVIRLRVEDCLVGTVQATIGPAERGPEAEISWVVGTPWQGQRIATEATRALVAWLGTQSVRTVIAHIHPAHRASVAVATAAGLGHTDRQHDGESRWELDLTPDGPAARSADGPPGE